MSDDRGWMYRRVGEKAKKEYLNGVKEFLDFAFSKLEFVDNGRIRCPSVVCDFLKYKSRDDVHMCLLHYGFVPNYTTWSKHGESPLEDHMVDDVVEGNENWPREMVMEAARPFFESNEIPPTNPKKFYDLLHTADEPLWEGCEAHTKDTQEIEWVSEAAKEKLDKYGQKLQELNMDFETPVNELPDPDLEAWTETVGGVKKGTLEGRPGEKWSSRRGMRSVREVATQENADEIKKLHTKLDDASNKLDVASTYIAQQYEFMKAITQQLGSPPPPMPPAELCPSLYEATESSQVPVHDDGSANQVP